jgi:hypothetical protein
MFWFVRPRRLISLVIVVGFVTAFVIATAGPPAVTPTAPGTFAFGALGDAPYDALESARYPLMLEDLDRHDLAFSIHRHRLRSNNGLCRGGNTGNAHVAMW